MSIFIIAEAGVNHNGSIEMAKQLIDVAVEAGANAVKFQTFKAENMVRNNAPKAKYQERTTGIEESQYEMIKSLELDQRAHEELIGYCLKRGIQFLSTPFDLESLDLLVNTFALPILKISSGEITNAPLLLKAAQTGKPIILSTGMSTMEEIERALGVLAFGYNRVLGIKPSLESFRTALQSEQGMRALQDKVTLLHCTTEYPAPFEEINLRAIETLRRAFGLKVGYSDHSNGIAIPIAAVAMGVTVIEKHFTLNKNLPGPDHLSSLDPNELKEMVRMIHQVEAALGTGLKIPTTSEEKNKSVARKSLVTVKNILQGESFTEDNLGTKRPGTGISPMHYWEWLGKRAKRDYQVDEEV